MTRAHPYPQQQQRSDPTNYPIHRYRTLRILNLQADFEADLPFIADIAVAADANFELILYNDTVYCIAVLFWFRFEFIDCIELAD